MMSLPRVYPSMNTSDLLVACLEDEGVDYVFGLPGEELEDLLFSLADSSVEFIPTRHEQGAAFMADVHGRLTGEPGVCVSTLGPGAMNLLTGVADAHLDKSPLVAITGQGGRERLHKESHQRLNVVGIFEPVTKWNTQLDDPDIVAEAVRKAFKTARHEKPGATHLELPEDIAASETDAEPLAIRPDRSRPAPDPDTVERAVEVLSAAERPLVLAGNGVVRSRCNQELDTFVETTDYPVVATYMGKGALSDRDDRSLMTLDSPGVETVVERADAVLAAGYDIAEHDPADWNQDGEKRIVHLDTQPAEVDTCYNPEVETVCDVAAGLRALSDAAPTATDTDWYADERTALAETVAGGEPDGPPFTVEGVLPVLRDVLNDEDVLVSDVGSHKMAIARRYPTYEPGTCVISNGLASMGIAVPGAVAADLAVDGNVVAATGDGGFLMNAAELEVATRLGLSLTVVVFRDDDYGLISEKQMEHRGAHTGTRIGNPDFQQFAEAFGLAAYVPESGDTLAEALTRAVASDEVSLVEVPVA